MCQGTVGAGCSGGRGAEGDKRTARTGQVCQLSPTKSVGHQAVCGDGARLGQQPTGRAWLGGRRRGEPRCG